MFDSKGALFFPNKVLSFTFHALHSPTHKASLSNLPPASHHCKHIVEFRGRIYHSMSNLVDIASRPRPIMHNLTLSNLFYRCKPRRRRSHGPSKWGRRNQLGIEFFTSKIIHWKIEFFFSSKKTT